MPCRAADNETRDSMIRLFSITLLRAALKIVLINHSVKCVVREARRNMRFSLLRLFYDDSTEEKKFGGFIREDTETLDALRAKCVDL